MTDSFLVFVRARSFADLALPMVAVVIAVIGGVGAVLGLRDPNLARAYYDDNFARTINALMLPVVGAILVYSFAQFLVGLGRIPVLTATVTGTRVELRSWYAWIYRKRTRLECGPEVELTVSALVPPLGDVFGMEQSILVARSSGAMLRLRTLIPIDSSEIDGLAQWLRQHGRTVSG